MARALLTETVFYACHEICNLGAQCIEYIVRVLKVNP
jgi:hypothetical protein